MAVNDSTMRILGEATVNDCRMTLNRALKTDRQITGGEANGMMERATKYEVVREVDALLTEYQDKRNAAHKRKKKKEVEDE